MAIKKYMRHVRALGLRLSHNHRMTGSRTHRGLATDAVELGGKPFGRLGAIARIGGVGRDRWDFDEFKEPPKGGFEVGIDLRQDRVERRHEISLSIISGEQR